MDGSEQVRSGLNAWLRDTSVNGAVSQSNGTLFAVLDTAQFVETTGKWAVFTTPLFSGTVTSATTSSLTCSSLPFSTRELDNGAVVKITGGTGAGQLIQVDNNYAPPTQITMKTNWTTIPDATSTFEIYKVSTYDGVHPSRFGHIAMSEGVTI